MDNRTFWKELVGSEGVDFHIIEYMQGIARIIDRMYYENK
jgi:hypothetical protein